MVCYSVTSSAPVCFYSAVNDVKLGNKYRLWGMCHYYLFVINSIISLWKSEFQAACENCVDSTDSPRNNRIFYESTKRLFLSHCATHFLLFILKPLISSLSTRSNKAWWENKLKREGQREMREQNFRSEKRNDQETTLDAKHPRDKQPKAN